MRVCLETVARGVHVPGTVIVAVLLVGASASAQTLNDGRETLFQSVSTELESVEFASVSATPSAFLRAGAAFSVAGGFLNDGLKTGSTVQAGIEVPLIVAESRSIPATLFYAEIAGAYFNNKWSGPAIDTGETFFCPL